MNLTQVRLKLTMNSEPGNSVSQDYEPRFKEAIEEIWEDNRLSPGQKEQAISLLVGESGPRSIKPGVRAASEYIKLVTNPKYDKQPGRRKNPSNYARHKIGA